MKRYVILLALLTLVLSACNTNKVVDVSFDKSKTVAKSMYESKRSFEGTVSRFFGYTETENKVSYIVSMVVPSNLSSPNLSSPKLSMNAESMMDSLRRLDSTIEFIKISDTQTYISVSASDTAAHIAKYCCCLGIPSLINMPVDHELLENMILEMILKKLD
jgi:hypothetical protein